jgi:hypothetical protein
MKGAQSPYEAITETPSGPRKCLPLVHKKAVTRWKKKGVPSRSYITLLSHMFVYMLEVVCPILII